MENITSIASLKNAIQLLEAEQTVKEVLLKEQFHLTYESLKPVNIIKDTFKEVSSSPFLINNIIGAATGLASGYLSKKIVVAGSGNVFRKLLGSILQFGITNVVSRHPDGVRTIGQSILQLLFRKKEPDPIKES